MSDIQEKMMALQRRRIASGAGSKHKKRGGSKTKKRGGSKPKKSNSKAMGRAQNNGWLKFFAKYRKEHQGKYPATKMMVKAGASWRRLSDKEKCKYSKKDMSITGGYTAKACRKSKSNIGGSKSKKKMSKAGGSKSRSGGSKTKKRKIKGGCGQCPHCGK